MEFNKNLTYISLLFYIFVLIVIFVYNYNSVSPVIANKMLKEHGYTDIELTGKRILGDCKSGVSVEGFKSKDKNGKTKIGYVCASERLGSIHEEH
jgi:hypothetical protein